jgi:hypothetical protein
MRSRAVKRAIPLCSVPIRNFAGVCLAVVLSAHCLWASLGGTISGRVSDPHGLPVRGASIAAVNAGTHIRLSVATDADGVYSVPNLPVGTYDLEVEVTGFKTYRRTRIVVDANSAIREDIPLVQRDAAGKRSCRAETQNRDAL